MRSATRKHSRTITFVLLAMVLAVPAFAGVTITSPTSGSTVPSSVHFVASATGSYPISSMRIYVDYKSVYSVYAASLNTYVSLNPGGHNVIVQAWDTHGNVYKSSRDITVSGTSSGGVVVSSPASGSTTGSPVHFVASASSAYPITTMRIYVDSQSLYSTSSNRIDKYLSIAAGKHYAVIQAWNSTGAVFKTPVSFSVGSGSSTSSSSSTSGAVSVSISPTSTSVAGGGSKQFTAYVSGTTNTKVNWLVNGVLGGNSTVGTISSSGLYTAPACPSTSKVTVTAQSWYDTSKTASAGVSLSGSSTAAGHYYVSASGSDSNSGSACRPWATLAHAANLAQPGWTIHVGPGTYYSAVTTSKSGTSTARIRYVSDARWGAKINSSGAHSVWTNNGNYVDIVGFDVTGSGSSIGILNWGSYVRILGNHVHHIPASACDSNGGAGIDNARYTGSNDDVIGNLVNDIGPLTTSCNKVHGIYHSNNGGHVWNNTVYRIAGYGLHFWHSPRNVSVSNNLVFAANRGGLIMGSDGTSGIYTTNMKVTNNIIYKNGGVGMKESGSYIGSGNQFSNNVVYGNSSGAYSLIKGTVSNTINADPQFVNFQASGSGDYHLRSTSPALNKGTSLAAPPEDMVGAPRPVGGAWDVGVYEYGTSASRWPWF